MGQVSVGSLCGAHEREVASGGYERGRKEGLVVGWQLPVSISGSASGAEGSSGHQRQGKCDEAHRARAEEVAKGFSCRLRTVRSTTKCRI